MILPGFLMLTLGLPGGFKHLNVLNDSLETKKQIDYDKNANDGLTDDDFAKIKNFPLSYKEMRPGERERDELNKVIYLTKTQREDYELRAREGQLFRKDGIIPFNTKRFYGEKKLLFVISKLGQIYAARGVSLKVHHSSLLAG